MVSFTFNPDPTVTKPEEHVLARRWPDVYPSTIKINDQFSGNLDFEFSQSASESCDFSNSYFEFDIELRDTSGASISGYALSATNMQQGLPTIYPSFNGVGAMFSSFTHTINGVSVITVPEYAVTDTHNKRCSMSRLQEKTWMANNLCERDDIERLMRSGFADCSGATVDTKYRYAPNFIITGSRVNTIAYQPTVGLFYNDTTTTGAMRHRLSFTIDPNYKKNFVTCSGNRNPSTTTTAYDSYNVVVSNVVFHPCLIKNDLPMYSGEHYERVAAHTTQQITVTSANQQLIYNVEPSTYKLSFFERSGDVGTNNAFMATRFNASGFELLMSRAPRITYASQVQPAVDRTWTVLSANLSGSTLVGPQTSYYQYMLANGYNSSNSDANETFLEWAKLGALFTHRFDKPLDDRSTQVTVNLAHSVNVSSTNNILAWLVAQYDRVIKLTYSNGEVVNVDVQNA